MSNMSIESRSRQYGKVFDHWQIREFLGSGSGGKTAVFRLVRSDSDRGASALKVVNLIEERGSLQALSPRRREEYEAVRHECSCSAEQEVWMMDDLRGNTNIVDYLDHTFVDWADDTGFGRDLLIRMELLKDLRSEMRSGKCYSEMEILKIGRDICTALILCHRKNILHRDVKPENIFLNKDGNYKLGDFGVSRVLDACPGAVASTGIGTYEYWPAEQMTGRYDTRVDTYSLGLVLYELCNQNRLPFAASVYATSKEVSLRLSGAPLPSPCNASPELAAVIMKACAFSPEDRFASAEEMLKALRYVSVARKKAAGTPLPQSVQKIETPAKIIEKQMTDQEKSVAAQSGKQKKHIFIPLLLLLLGMVLAAGIFSFLWTNGKKPDSDALQAEPPLLHAEEAESPSDSTDSAPIPESVESTTPNPPTEVTEPDPTTETAEATEPDPTIDTVDAAALNSTPDPTEASEISEPAPPSVSSNPPQLPLYGVVSNRHSILNIRSGPALTEKLMGTYTPGTKIEILETMQTNGIQWGRTDKGWVCMTYVHFTELDASILYTGWVIHTDQLNVRSEPSLSAEIEKNLDRGENIFIYETTVSEGYIWGHIDSGWVSLHYVDMVPTTLDAVDVRVIAQSNTPVYANPTKDMQTGHYDALTVAMVYAYVDVDEETMARTDSGWVKDTSFVK